MIDATINATLYQIQAVIEGDTYQLTAAFGAGPTGARGPAGEVTGPNGGVASGDLVLFDGDSGKKLKGGGPATAAALGGVEHVGPRLITGIWRGSQAQYDAIPSPDATVLYVVEEA